MTVNLVLAVVMAIVMVVRAELKTGRFLVIDFLLVLHLYSDGADRDFFGPVGESLESYLYRPQEGSLVRVEKSDETSPP